MTRMLKFSANQIAKAIGCPRSFISHMTRFHQHGKKRGPFIRVSNNPAPGKRIAFSFDDALFIAVVYFARKTGCDYKTALQLASGLQRTEGVKNGTLAVHYRKTMPRELPPFGEIYIKTKEIREYLSTQLYS